MGWIRPSFIDGMSWAMGEVYGAITDQILINLAHYFPYWKPGESVPKSSFEYQAHMLAQMGQVNRDTIRIIASGLGGGKSALTNILEQAIMEGVRKAQPDLLKGVRRGILKPAGLPIVDPSQTRAFQFYYNQAAQKMNLVNTVMLESTRQAYQATVSDVVNRVNATQSALNIGAGETVTGVSSWNEAMRHSIDRMKDNGITGFIDHAGHRWSAEAYVSMDIRTTVANTARSAVWETNQNLGNDLYIVSYHDGARPLCYPYQNKVISSTDNARTVIDLDGNEIEVIAQSNTSYGEAAGLFGINCKHYPTPFIPGVSVLYDQGNIMGEKENEAYYQETQQQRALERKLREEKRDILMAKAQGATAEQLEPLRERARQTSRDIDDFCDETGLPRRRNREGVYTQRDFPDPSTYDPKTFERDQKDVIDKYFQTGGTQTPYTFGQMTPNTPLVPNPPKTVTPVQNVAQNATQAAQPVVQSNAEPFTPAKTVSEAQKFAQDNHLARSVSYTGNVSTDVVNAVNRELMELRARYPSNELVVLKQNGRISANASSNGGLLQFNGRKINGATKTVEEFHAEAKSVMERLSKMFPDGNIPSEYMDAYRKCQERLKYQRWSVSSSYGTINATIPHEYGHILSDQYFGMINGRTYCPEAFTPEAREKVRLVEETYRRAKKTGDIYGLSQYASTDAHEFLAEAFASKWMGETLPDYIESMLGSVFGD